MPSPLALELAAIVMRRADERAAMWFAAEYQQVQPGLRTAAFLESLSETTKRLGRQKVEYSSDERAALLGVGIATIPPALRLDEAGAGALWLEGVAGLNATECARLVHNVFYRGTMDQRCTLLKFLYHIPDPGRFVELAVEAACGQSQDVKCALLLHNPYPVHYLSDPFWGIVVGVAVREGLPLDQIIGLKTRLIPEVIKQVEAYSVELRRFRRPIPPDITELLQYPRSS